MAEDGRSDESCDLCGRAIDEHTVARSGSETFCSDGCRTVAATLGTGDGDDAASAESLADGPASKDASEATAPGLTRTYLRIDGMHSATCEAYLESVADGLDGVADAEASYVTESIRVDHDPGRTSDDDLRGALSTLGYTAYLRDDATASTESAEGTTRRAREVSGLRDQRATDMLDARYIVGVVFGSFLLVPYVAVLYPAHLASVFPVGPLQYFDTAFSEGGVLFARVYFVLTGMVLYFTGKPLLRGAYVSLKLRRPNADLLAAITIVAAYLYGTVGAVFGRGEVYYDLVIVVAALVMGAILFESSIKRRAMDRLTDLTFSQVDSARLYVSGATTEVDVEDLESGDRVLVRQGERVPIDGVLAEGECTIDESVVTGESVPVEKAAGDDVLGGSVVTTGAAIVRATAGTTSSIDRLTTAVWNLQSAEHGIQRRSDLLAERALPLLAGSSILVGVAAVALGSAPVDAALAVLATVIVVSPWALGFATPLTIATAIEAALERGIVVFDETVFERLRAVDVVVFDKTGTLTRGRMDVLEADAPADLLEAAGHLERRAAHPAAKAIAGAFADTEGAIDERRPDGGRVDEREGGDGAGDDRIEAFESHAKGVEGRVDGERVLVGHPDLFAERGWGVGEDIERRVHEAREAGRLPIVVGRDGAAAGVVIVGDEPREGWDETVAQLGDRGTDVIVLTGDDESATEAFADHDAVEHVFAGVSPAGKVAAIRRLKADGDRIAMVGDGTNDALALAEADLGISLGSGTALASDAADLAILEDDLGAVETAFDLAAGARRRVEQNVRLALVYNAITVPIALAGVLNPLFATSAAILTAGVIAANAWRSPD